MAGGGEGRTNETDETSGRNVKSSNEKWLNEITGEGMISGRKEMVEWNKAGNIQSDTKKGLND